MIKLNSDMPSLMTDPASTAGRDGDDEFDWIAVTEPPC